LATSPIAHDRQAGAGAAISIARNLQAEGGEMTMPELGWTTDGRISRVLDGDTVEVEVTRKFVVRLRDCWAPEMEPIEHRRRWLSMNDIPPSSGMASQLHLQMLANGYQVRLHVVGSEDGDFRDSTSMGRVIGDVYLRKDGTSLAEAQVAAGHAMREKPK
jgi:endonuclease YncB( thermonuclease family)